MISYIKQILWWRRLLVALFADLAFCQLAVINSADLKYQLHLFQGAINKLLQPIKGASFLRLFVKPGQTDMGSVQAALASAEHVWVQVFHMLTDLSFTLLAHGTFLLEENLTLGRQQIVLVLLGLGKSLTTCLKCGTVRPSLAGRVKNEWEIGKG